MVNQKEEIAALKEGYERYELAISAANIGVWDWVTSTDIVYYSKIWKAQVGYQEDELANNFETWKSLLHPDESEGVQRRVAEYLEDPEGKYVNEFRFRHKNGSYIWILAKAEVLKDKKGNVIRMFGSHTDITQKKDAEQQLKAISDQSSEGITIADMDGNYVFVNPAFCEMSGYTEAELLKMTVFDMKAQNQDHSSFQKTKESPQLIRVTLQKKDGTEYFSEIIGDVITVQNKKLVLGTIRDVTVRVNAEMKVEELNENLELLIKQRTKELDLTVVKLNKEIEQRVLAEKQIQESLAVKEVLLKEITHRVKNNLQIISSLIRLQKGVVKNPEAVDLLSQTANRIQSMALIHETLYKTNTFDDIVFKDYVESLINYIKTIFDARYISITVGIGDYTLPINAATNFGMIIMELVTNSIKYAFPDKKGAKVSVLMELTNNDQYKLTISDNGIGFPEHLNFKTTESLGMQVVVSLTEQLEGSVNLLNKEGTTFEIVV